MWSRPPKEAPVVNEPLALVVVDGAKVTEFLGPDRFRDLDMTRKSEIGVTVGLAWTEVGGQV